MSKTKFGKKIVSLVLALAMVFAVATTASAHKGVVALYTDGPVGKAAEKVTHTLIVTSPLTTAGAKTTVLAHDALDTIGDGVKAVGGVVLLNPVTQLGRFNTALLPLELANAGQRVADKLIIKNDALLFGLSSLGAVNNGIEAAGNIAVRDVALLTSLNHKAVATVLGVNDLAHLGWHSLLLAKDNADALAILGHALAHPGFLPLTHVNALLINQLGINHDVRHAFYDVADLIKDGLIFNTPISDSLAAFNEALLIGNVIGVGVNALGQLTGVNSILLGKALALHNFNDYFRNIRRAANITLARDAVDAVILHHIDEQIHGAAVLAAVGAANVAVAAPVVGAAALGTAAVGALGLAGLTAANVAGAAALAAPVVTTAVAAPVVGAALVGAGLAGTAALAAPVVATAVAAPVVGAALVGAGVAGATALGAGALGAAALASNLLGGNDSSSSNTTAATPVQTVANAVESVLPSNDQNTQTETQAQETTNTSDASVASTDGPIE